jgi:subtilase family serine protease
MMVVLLAGFSALAERQVVRGHVPAAVGALGLQPIETLPDSTRVDLAIQVPVRDQEGLSNLVQQLYDPKSPNFHRYLTPEQFTKQFGPTEADYQNVVNFAKNRGFTVRGTEPSRTVVDVSGSVAQIRSAFHVNMNVYRHPKEDRTFYAPDMEPSLDLAAPVAHIAGLNDYYVPHPLGHMGQPTPLGGSGGGGSYYSADLRAAYAPGVTLDGSGQSVGLLEFDGYYAGDISTYKQTCGITNPITLTNVLVDSFSGNPSTNIGTVFEVSLDIEMAIAMAPGLSKVYVYEATNQTLDLLTRMANDNTCQQLSCSWDLGDSSSFDTIYMRFQSQGQSFFQASGDNGAYVGFSGDFADSPYITVVGGTVLTTSGPAGSWVSETVWNQYPAISSGDGSGGGISPVHYAIPSWQSGVSMASNQGSTSNRNSPDVSMVASNVFVVSNNGFQGTGTYGTSIAAPLWAGFTALINQQAASKGQPQAGFVNPVIYQIGQGPYYGSDFHDVTSGNNFNSSSTSAYSAVTGYDLCTGWGTPTGMNLINMVNAFGYSGLVWVNFGKPTFGNGTYLSPYNTISGGISGVASGGTIMIQGPGSTTEKPSITKHLTIRSVAGTGTIGQ